MDVFADFDGKVDLKHLQLNAKSDVGVMVAFAPGRNVSVEYQNNVTKGARTGLRGEEALHGVFNWTLSDNVVQADETAYSFTVRGEGTKKFNNDRLSGSLKSTFVMNTMLDSDVAVAVSLNNVFSTGRDGHGFEFTSEGKGLVGYTVSSGGGTSTNGDAYRIVIGPSFSGRVRTDMQRTSGSVTGGFGLHILNKNNITTVCEAFVEKNTFDNDVLFGINILNCKLRGRSIDDNVITNNGMGGIQLAGGTEADVARNTISGNGIGMVVRDTAVALMNDNMISRNRDAGVRVRDLARASLTGDAIFSSGGLGIDVPTQGGLPVVTYPVRPGYQGHRRLCPRRRLGSAACTLAPTAVKPTPRGELRTYTVTDAADNKLVLETLLRRMGHELRARLVSLQYCTSSCGRLRTPPANAQTFAWATHPDGSLQGLQQKLSVGSGTTGKTLKRSLTRRGIRPPTTCTAPGWSDLAWHCSGWRRTTGNSSSSTESGAVASAVRALGTRPGPRQGASSLCHDHSVSA